jgi:hypothetical protein
VYSYKKKKRCDTGTPTNHAENQKCPFFRKCSYSEKAVSTEKTEILAHRKMQVGINCKFIGA